MWAASSSVRTNNIYWSSSIFGQINLVLSVKQDFDNSQLFPSNWFHVYHLEILNNKPELKTVECRLCSQRAVWGGVKSVQVNCDLLKSQGQRLTDQALNFNYIPAQHFKSFNISDSFHIPRTESWLIWTIKVWFVNNEQVTRHERIRRTASRLRRV